MLASLKRFILWDYSRASWQYDVMVGLILAFIFFTPRAFFRDQPRTPQASRITMLPAERGTHVFWIEAELLAGATEEQRTPKAEDLLRLQTGQKQRVVSLEPVLDSDQEIKGFIAITGTPSPGGN
ncbi:MAG: hypothetical protein AAB225_11195 [Acidobacteriota bacterium]